MRDSRLSDALARLGEALRRSGPPSASRWRWAPIGPDRYPEALWIECAEIADDYRKAQPAAPEAARERACDRLADVWALGVEASLRQGACCLPSHFIGSQGSLPALIHQ